MIQMKHNQKGITLIALVITIIVLLILAAVSIAAISPGDGIIDNASDARDNWNGAMDKDENKMNEVLEMNNKINNN